MQDRWLRILVDELDQSGTRSWLLLKGFPLVHGDQDLIFHPKKECSVTLLVLPVLGKPSIMSGRIFWYLGNVPTSRNSRETIIRSSWRASSVGGCSKRR